MNISKPFKADRRRWWSTGGGGGALKRETPNWCMRAGGELMLVGDRRPISCAP
jgi:hypothetical protein